MKKLEIDKRALCQLLEIREVVDALEGRIDIESEIDEQIFLETVKEVYTKMREELHSEGFKQRYKEKHGTKAYHERSSRYKTVKSWCRYLT